MADVAPVVTTKRTSPTTIETTLSGRVTAEMISEMAAAYRKLGGRSVWIIAAEGTRSYAPDAVERAVREFGALQKEHGLALIVAIIQVPLVRMGASVVSASLRALGSPLQIRVVERRSEVTSALVL